MMTYNFSVEEDDICYPSTLLGLAASYLNEYKHASSTDCLAKWLLVSHPGALTKGQSDWEALWLFIVLARDFSFQLCTGLQSSQLCFVPRSAIFLSSTTIQMNNVCYLWHF